MGGCGVLVRLGVVDDGAVESSQLIRNWFAIFWRNIRYQLIACHPTVSVEERRARLLRAIESDEHERFHDVYCRYCGKRWCVNQWHNGPFSCADAVQHDDYVALSDNISRKMKASQ